MGIMNPCDLSIRTKAGQFRTTVAKKKGGRTGFPPLVVGVLVWTAVVMAGTFTASALDPNALPTGGQIVAGQGSIAQKGSAMTVTQGTDRMVANWNTFNIGQNASVSFQQPGAGSVALNRIQDQNPSQIFGSLTANGRVFLLNPAGIYFSPTAQVDVGGLVASSLNLTNENFLNGNYRFEAAGGAGGITNQGTIRTANGGYVAFLSPNITNEGTISAPGGTVAMAAGGKVNLDFTGDRLVNFTVEQGVIDALIENRGLVQADGGTVILTAKAADALTQAVVNNAGVIEARGITEQGGRIVLDAEGGQTTLSGTLDASSEGGRGGAVIATGERVLVESGAHLTASGAAGGGEVLVGGNWQGKDPTIRQATGTVVEQGALLEANATDTGNGGTVVAWSDVTNPDSVTRAYGTFEAKGGLNGGDGGRIETSGHWLDVTGAQGGASATSGKAGLWLFDPYNVTITGANANGGWGGGDPDLWTPSASSSTLLNTDINAKLNGGTSVTVTTSGAGGDIGDISVSSAITKSSGESDVTLTLQAVNSIAVDQAISNSGGAGKLHVVLDADNNGGVGDGAGIVLLNADITTNGGNLSFGTGRTATINGVSTLVGGDVYVAGSGARTLATNGGAVNVQGEMIVANTSGLTINSNNGNVRFYGLLNSGDTYASVASALTWDNALSAAKGVTGGGSTEGDTYLATITSRLENAVAGRAVNYQPSWLGARRVTGIGTNAIWRWVAGPEGLQDSGKGLGFFTQNGSDTVNGSSGTSLNGGYSNWNSGEPNNFMGSNLSVETESALQFTGTVGQWNDLSRSTGTLNYYVRETNLAASPVTINAGTGTVTFSGAVGTSKALRSLTVAAATTAIDGGAVMTNSGGAAGAQSYSGDITLGGANTVLTMLDTPTDFTVASGKSITNATGADATLTVKTSAGIVLDTNSSLSSSAGKLNTVLWSDTDANGGYLRLNSGSAIATKGGNLWLGGGSGSTTWNGLTVGDGYAMGDGGNSNGILINGASLSTTGGNIALHGQSLAGNAVGTDGLNVDTHADGIRLSNVAPSTINSGAGTILMDGVSQGTNKVAIGVEFDSTAPANSHLITSAAAAGDAITITGTGSASAGTTSSNGIHLQSGTTVSATGGGNIVMTGAGGTAGDKSAIDIDSGSAVNAGAGNLTLTGDTLALAGTVSGTGGLTIKPKTGGTPIGIAGGAGTLSLPVSYFLTNIVDGFAGITVGSPTAGTITLGGATTFNDNIALVGGGNIALNAALNAGGQTVTLTGGNGATVSGNGSITAAGLLLNGNNATYALNTAAGNSVGTLAAGNGAGNLSFLNGAALEIGTAGGVNGIGAAGTVDVATKTGNLTVSRNIATTDASADAIKLNAGRDTAAGTAAGGDIVLSGAPAVTTGAGGRATLYTGSVSGSTGLTALIGSGTGHFRYDSDESDIHYTTALGVGNYAVYREQPTLTVTPGNTTVTYGDAVPAFTAGYGAYANGDSSPGAVTGTATWSVGGPTSTSGRYTAGGHNVLYTGGLVSGLGYGFADNAASGGELLVNPKAITATGITAAGKTYDGGLSAVLDTGGAILTGGAANGSDKKYYTGDLVTLGVGGAAGSFADKNAGGGKAVSVTGLNLAAADADNYTVSDASNATAGIAAKALALSATAANKTYDGNANATVTGYGLSGFVGTETVTAASAGALFDTKNVGAAKTVTISGITLANGTNGGLASNYSVAGTTTATADITPAALSLTAGDASKTYGQTLTFGGTEFTSAGLQNGETVGSVTLTSLGAVATAGVAGSPYAIIPSAAAGGTFTTANYTITYHNGALTVSPATLTVTARDDSRNYNGLAYRGGNGVLYAGLVNGETSNDLGGTLAYGGTSQGAVNTGAYVIEPSGVTAGNNYVLHFVNGALQITVNSNSENVNAGLTSTQQAVNGTQQNQGGNPGTPTTPSLGPGAGSTTLANVANAAPVAGPAPSAGNVVLSATTFSSPVTISTSGQTMTLGVGGTGAGTPAATAEVGTLSVFTQNGNAAASLQGNFVVREGSNSLSLTQTTAAGIAAVLGLGNAASAPSAPFTLTQENGVTLQLSATVTREGTLVITAPDAAVSLDVRQVVLMATQVARQVLQTDVRNLSSALVVTGLM
jgi:fibronectin-binding autotransporter adhesin